MSYTTIQDLPRGPSDYTLARRWAAVGSVIEAQLLQWRPHARILPQILAYRTTATREACEENDDGSTLHCSVPQMRAAIKQARRGGATEVVFLAQCFNQPGDPTISTRHRVGPGGDTTAIPVEIHVYACRLRYREGGAELDVWDSSGRQTARRGRRRDLAPRFALAVQLL